MSSGEKKIRLIEPLPQRVPYCTRFRAEQLTQGRQVEFRLFPDDAPPELLPRFQDELEDLVLLDHPSFLPVLERGVTRGKGFYMVPLRSGSTLAEILEDPAFPLEDRCRIVRGLANALTALHLVQTAVGPPQPAVISWDADKQNLHYAHHRLAGTPPKGVPPEVLPEDVRPQAPPTLRADVFHWAHLAYRILTRGEEPIPEGCPRPTPIRAHVPELDPVLAHSLEACLHPDPARRPEHAGEIHAVLLGSPRNLVPAEELEMEASGTIPEIRIERSIADLKLSGRVPLPRQRPPAPPPERGTGAFSAVDPTRNRTLLAVALGAAALLLGLCLLAYVLVGGPTAPPATPPPPSRAVQTEPEEDPVRLQLAPSRQAAYRQDPLIRELLLTSSVGADEFTRLWKILRDLSLGGRLPPQLDDQKRIVRLRSAHRLDAARARRELQAYLEELRDLLGTPRGGER